MGNFVTKEYELNLSIQEKNRLSLGKLLDVEKLLRLNPFWFVDNLHVDGQTFQTDLKDYRNDKQFQLSGRLSTDNPETLSIAFDNGDWHQITLFTKNGMLWAKVDFREQEPEPESDEEQNIIFWLRGIKQYLRLFLKTTLNTLFFRMVMNKMVLTMNPSQRKICLMLVRLTIVEILVIVFIVIGYVIYVLKPGGAP